MENIEGGYIILAKSIQDSDIANAPPHVREMWIYLLRKAFYKDFKEYKRGQYVGSYDAIIEGLSWNIGWRKMTYKRSDIENGMKYLRRAAMITTARTTSKFIVTICNYDYYQQIENYESYRKATKKPAGKPQESHEESHHNITKEEKKKEERNNIKSDILTFDEFWNTYDKKKGKAASLKEWQKLKAEDISKIKLTLKNYLTHHSDPQFRKDPERYLKHKSFNDELYQKPKGQNGQQNNGLFKAPKQTPIQK